VRLKGLERTRGETRYPAGVAKRLIEVGGASINQTRGVPRRGVVSICKQSRACFGDKRILILDLLDLRPAGFAQRSIIRKMSAREEREHFAATRREDLRKQRQQCVRSATLASAGFLMEMGSRNDGPQPHPHPHPPRDLFLASNDPGARDINVNIAFSARQRESRSGVQIRVYNSRALCVYTLRARTLTLAPRDVTDRGNMC